MLNVYIADLANDFIEIDNKSIPIGIGYVGAYCKEKFKDNLNVLPFRLLAPLLKEMELAPPTSLALVAMTGTIIFPEKSPH